jgi:hypothetical protein
MIFDFHRPHQVLLPMAKSAQVWEDDVKMDNVTGLGVKVNFPPLP